MDHGGGDFRGEGADGLAAHDVAGSGVEDLGGLLTLQGLEGGLLGAESLRDTWRKAVSTAW